MSEIWGLPFSFYKYSRELFLLGFVIHVLISMCSFQFKPIHFLQVLPFNQWLIYIEKRFKNSFRGNKISCRMNYHHTNLKIYLYNLPLIKMLLGSAAHAALTTFVSREGVITYKVCLTVHTF